MYELQFNHNHYKNEEINIHNNIKLQSFNPLPSRAARSCHIILSMFKIFYALIFILKRKLIICFIINIIIMINGKAFWM